MRIKAKDIAKALGVSEATVSLVQNDKPGVNEQTRQRVREYIEKIEQQHYLQSKAESQESKGTLLMLFYVKHGFVMERGGSTSVPHFLKIRSKE